MATCTVCGEEMAPLTKYIAGRWVGSGLGPYGCQRLNLTWACEHFPADDAAVRLASKACVETFCKQHPEYIDAVIALMSQYEQECRHEFVN